MRTQSIKWISSLLIVTLSFVAGAQTGQGGVGQLTPVGFRMNWKFTGPHAAYFLGKELGYYAEEGIDLQLLEGNGSVNVAFLVGNKSDMFGLTDAAAILPALQEGLPVTFVGMVSPKTSLAVIAREDSGVRTLKDLEGKTVATTAGESTTQLWPAVLATNGISEDAIRLIFVDAAAKVPVVLENRAIALLGSSADQNFIIEAQGVPVVTLPFADNGVNVLNLGIVVHNDLLKENPDLIARFLRATRKSLEALPDNIELAAQLVNDATPELDYGVALDQTRAYATQIPSPNCPDAAALYNCPADWQMTIDIMSQYQGVELKGNGDQYYTNEFLD